MAKPQTVLGTLLLGFAIARSSTASKVGTAPPQPPRCTDREHRAWLDTCLARNGARSPQGWQWPIPASGYYAQADLVREFTSDCANKTATPVDTPAALPNACTFQAHVDWLQACVTELYELVGKTRAEAEKFLQTEGGLSTYTFRHFQHRRCMPLKAEVTFSTGDETEAPKDVVTSVVTYVGWPIMD